MYHSLHLLSLRNLLAWVWVKVKFMFMWWHKKSCLVIYLFFKFHDAFVSSSASNACGIICLYLDIGESIIYMLHMATLVFCIHKLSLDTSTPLGCFRKLLSGSPLINKQLTAVPDLVQWPLPYYEDDRIKPQSYVQYLIYSDNSSSYPPSTTAFFQGWQVLFYHEDFKTL